MFFQIFIPGSMGANIENLKKLGLDDLLSPNDDPPSCVETTHGPNGGHGQLWGWTDKLERVLGFNPEKHDAVQCVADPDRNLPAGRFWWIFPKGVQPDAKGLQRREMFDGYPVTLQNGMEWLVPTVLDLPQTFGFDDAGNVVKAPKNGWKSFVEAAEWSINQCLVAMGSDGNREWLKELNAAARFLSANYRVNRELLIKLQLIDPENVIQILMRAVDRDRLTALSNNLKNEEAGAATPAGSSV